MDEIRQILDTLKQISIEEYYDTFPQIEEWLWAWEERLKPKNQNGKQIRLLCGCLTEDLVEYPIWMKIHILSFCMQCSEEVGYVNKLSKEVVAAPYEELGEYNKYYVYWQIVNSSFSNTKLQSDIVEKNLVAVYRGLYEAFYQALQVGKYNYIPIEERNQEKIFVFTSQMLDEMHAPTKTLYDRCYNLQKYLQKKVTIVNTAMMTVQKGEIPFYNRKMGVYNSDFSNLQKIAFKGEEFELYQCENNMPDLVQIKRILDWVYREKPYCILNIGGGDLCADLCGHIVPEITVSTVFSGVATSCGKFQIISNILQETDRELLQGMGCKSENVIATPFTFVFKEQTHQYDRKMLELLEHTEVLVVIGWRLDSEVDDAFLQVLEDVLQEDSEVEVVFMGLYDTYEEKMERYPGLKSNSVYLKFQEDALAVLDCCNLYVNPKRKGGGSSAAEALYKGLPVVTVSFGDVAAAVGEEFCVSTYSEMKQTICQYIRDKAYYKEMSDKARKRAELLLDSRAGFCDAFNKIERMQDFQ